MTAVEFGLGEFLVLETIILEEIGSICNDTKSPLKQRKSVFV